MVFPALLTYTSSKDMGKKIKKIKQQFVLDT